MKLDLKSMPEGKIQCCIGNCDFYDTPSIHTSGSISIAAGKSESIETEWFIPAETTTPKCWTAVFTAGLCKLGAAAYEYSEDGPSIKVKVRKRPNCGNSV